MPLEILFTHNIIDHNASILVGIIDAHPGNVELCRGAWLQAIANVTAAGGEVAELERQCKLALGVDVRGLLETGIRGGVMFTINIRNDGTGTDEAANYIYAVMVNRKVIATGRVEGHKRIDGWRALVRRVLRETNR